MWVGALLSCWISAVLGRVLCVYAHLCRIWSDPLEGDSLDSRRVGFFVPDCNGAVASCLGSTFKKGCSADVRRRSRATGLLLVISDTKFFRLRATCAGEYQFLRRVPLPGSASLLRIALVGEPSQGLSRSIADLSRRPRESYLRE